MQGSLKFPIFVHLQDQKKVSKNTKYYLCAYTPKNKSTYQGERYINHFPEGYSELSQTAKMELYMKINPS